MRELERLVLPAVGHEGGLNVVVAVEEDGALLGVVAERADEDGRQVERLALELLRAHRDGADPAGGGEAKESQPRWTMWCTVETRSRRRGR